MKNLMMIGVLTIVGIIGLLEAPMSIDQHTEEFYNSIPAAVNVEADEEDVVEVMSLEKEFVSKDVIDGYVVEKYQEFEVYRDSSGKIIRSIPTSNYDYLRYFITKPE
jgi:hypothetical protein